MCSEGPIVRLGFGRICPKSLDGGVTYTQTASPAIELRNRQNGWPGNGAMDKDGNVYVVWVDDSDFLAYVAASKDKGKTWTAPVKFALNSFTATANPNISVKKPGYVAIAYYATEDVSDRIELIANMTGYALPDGGIRAAFNNQGYGLIARMKPVRVN